MTQPKLTDIKGVGPVLSATLTEKSFTVNSVAVATPDKISELLGVGPAAARAIIASAQAMTDDALKSQAMEPVLEKTEGETALEVEDDVEPRLEVSQLEKITPNTSSKGKKNKKAKKKAVKKDKKNKPGKKTKKAKKAKKAKKKNKKTKK